MHRLRTRYGKKEAIKKYWEEEAGPTELLVLMFLYFSAYLTGVGELLDRLNPPDKTVLPLITDDLNATTFTLATNASIETTDVSVDDFDNGWWWILLVFYALVPVAGCAFFGVVVQRDEDTPDDPIKYAEWLEEKSKTCDGFFISIIAPFEKKYSWCVTVLVMTRDTCDCVSTWQLE